MKYQKGQVLLITVMLLATVLTVVLAVSFRSTTETKLTKLEEERQKAFAAAEAGIEAALRQGNIANIGSLNVPTGFTGSATVNTTATTTFVSPTLQKDEAYTFYLSVPGGTSDNPNFNSLTPSYTNQSLNICFGASTGAPALDITLLKQNGVVKKYAMNPINPAATIISNAAVAGVPGANACPTNTTSAFTNIFTLPSGDIAATSLLLIVRVVSPSSTPTSVGFASTGASLPFQGRTIVSSAKSPSGAATTVQLFQSYPQIPADFFVTSF